MSSTDDHYQDIRAGIAEQANCTQEYLDETIELVKNGSWEAGEDVDRDSVVGVLSVAGISLLEMMDSTPRTEPTEPDYTKKGSVFDD